MQKQTFKWNEMTMGVCYYPEHWDASLWREDLRRMKAAGITVIRIAEFAWSKIERTEGVFTYDFFDRFLDVCEEEQMQVIFGTPTATPPAWLTEKYPEVLNARKDGVKMRHGARRHYNYNSPKYQELSARIVTKIAEHYAKHPAIVGWQIDNELNCEVHEFYSEADDAAFREFLKETYGTIEALNEAWGTVFWNQTYNDWSEVHILRTLPGEGWNPHQKLDYLRFVSASTLRFCKMQADILRKYKKEGDFITTNGRFGHMDNHKMENESLDVYTYDSYPNFSFGIDRKTMDALDLRDRYCSKYLTEVRSICPHFGIMEQQSGANGWVSAMEAPAPRPGQMTLWVMQSVANGADYISFFRWRTCTFGTEMYWHGILDYDNRDNRKLAEVKEISKMLKTLAPVCGASFKAAFAVLKDYDNEWDAEADRWHSRVLQRSDEEIYLAAELNHTPYDMVYLQPDTTAEELRKYPVLFYPHPVLMSQKRADLLRAYVEQGGTLILGCRSAYKDMNGRCVMMPQPGLLQELTGSDVREFTFTSPAEEEVCAVWNGRKMEMPLFNDILEIAEGAEDAEVLAVYGNSYYKGKPAMIEKRTGKGRTIHLGAAFSMENVKMLLDYTGVLEPFAGQIKAPQEVAVIGREKDGKTYYFVLNYLPETQRVTLQTPMKSLYDGQELTGEVELPALGTLVLEVMSDLEF